MTTDFKTLLAGAKLPETTVPICLRGDLVAEFEDLERQLEEALRAPVDSLEGDGSASIAERMEQLRAQMREHTYPFRLRAMTRPAWHGFVLKHPPRRDEAGEIDERDRLRLVNVETFFPALIRESVVDPQLDEDEWRQLLGDDDDERQRREREGKPVEDGVLTDWQYGELADAAWGLNRRDVDVPFSRAASRMTRSSGTE